ncbi:hypothetical protein [Peribacillus asahii]|uniref:hypothetical protein n=1 Tax=Peribacillus asahii TaxID=228899 RepID=UPI0020798BBF|nr:hypothetical protein [Peribacillus asahii]USK72621.1 hypothetical protein LIS76_23540 [Peribacillus asahii]USK72737.1 hypothetical protein LIS76_23720 [Peribacillus asahii]
MRVHELSSEAKSICKENYKTNCGQCPLRPACTASPRLTEESHMKWIATLNSMAQNIIGTVTVGSDRL